MKKLALLSLALLISAMLFSQQDPIFVPGTTQHDYLKKSKRQKTTAWVFLGTGSLSVIVGSIEINPNYGETTNRPFLVVGGLILAGASVPYFIASARNKKRVLSMSFKNEWTPGGLVNKLVPSLVLKINI
jgi:hypothetical protein